MEQPTPPRPPVSVKGREDGLHVTVTEPDASQLEASLRDQLERRKARFFAGAPVVLEMPPGPLDLDLAGRLSRVIAKAGMELTAVVSSRPEQPRRRPDADRAAAPPAPAGEGGSALVVAATVRGGQRISHDGTVVVLGDVNPGGEVVAGGSVIVWGRLRGHVEAGLAGAPERALVCALDLAPTQLRIGDALARAPEDPDRTPVPEVARAVDGMIVVETWR